jgi:hypothetical protein
MRMHLWIRIACLSLGLLAAGPAGAQSQTPSPEAMTAAREMMVAMGAPDQFKRIVPALVGRLKQAIVRNRPHLERDFDDIIPLLIESMDARMNEAFEEVAALYARMFTAEELREVVAFVRGPTGQKFLQKQPQMIQESTALGQRYAESLGAEFRARVINELRKRGHNI